MQPIFHQSMYPLINYHPSMRPMFHVGLHQPSMSPMSRHGHVVLLAPAVSICRSWAFAGECRFGSRCRFQHTGPARAERVAARTRAHMQGELHKLQQAQLLQTQDALQRQQTACPSRPCHFAHAGRCRFGSLAQHQEVYVCTGCAHWGHGSSSTDSGLRSLQPQQPEVAQEQAVEQVTQTTKPTVAEREAVVEHAAACLSVSVAMQALAEQVTQTTEPTVAALPAAVCHVADCQQALEPDVDANYCLQCKLWLCENCRSDSPGQHDPATHTLVLWAEREAVVEHAAACLSASVAMPAHGAASTAGLKGAEAVVAAPAPARSAAVVTADDLVRVLEQLGGQCSKAKLAHALLQSASREGKRTPVFDVVLVSALRSRKLRTDASNVFLAGPHRSTVAA